MRYSCLHTHTIFCDGHEDVEAMCRAAVEKGLVSIGFSSHAPIPSPFAEDSVWHMRADRLEEYAAAVHAARKRWEGRLDVYLGLEIDYISGVCGPADGRFAKLGLDYSIGSVHYLLPPNGAAPFTVDGPPEEWETGVREGFGGDGERAAAAYWEAVSAMVADGGFDIVGHLDLVKKNNRGRWFDQNGATYRALASATMDAIAESGAVVEVNTGGLIRGNTTEVYPAPWMLGDLRSRQVRMMINADAHRGEHLGGHYEEARRLLVAAGFDQVVLFSGRNPDGKAVRTAEPL